MNYAFLGLGFVQGWLWLFFLNGPLLFSEAVGWSINNETILLSFLLANSLSYLWVAKRPIRSISLYSSNVMLLTSALLMSGGVIMLKFTAGQIGEAYVVLALLGTVAAGFGSAIFIAAFGELFSFFSVTVASLSFAGSVSLGTVLSFAALKLSLYTAFLVTALCPIMALLFIILGRQQIPKPDLKLVKSPLSTTTTITSSTSTSVSVSAFAFPFPRRLVFLLIFFYLAGGIFYKMILMSSASVLPESYWLTNVFYCLVIIVAGSWISLSPTLDLSVLYRPVLPLLGAGFVLIPFFHESFVFLPLTLLQAGFALFDLYTWLLFAYIAKHYEKPAYVFGWGMFLITISIFTGETLFTLLLAKITYPMKEIEILSVCAALLMLAGTMLFQGKRDSYAGWETPVGQAKVASGLGQNSPEQILISEIASTFDIELNGLEELGETTHQKLEPKSESLEGQKKESIGIDIIREQFLLSLELTKREKEIALLLFDGRNNPYVRSSLNISNNTLKTHLKNIYHKAMVNDRQKLLDLLHEFVNNQT